MTLLVAPLFNPDGNDALDPANRRLDLAKLSGQIGPVVGIGLRPRKRADSTGMIVRLTTIETRSATVKASDNDWKNWPTTPRTNARGKKTRIVVRVEPITAPLISLLAESMAASPVWP